MIENKLKKLYFKPMNEIRLKGYQRAFHQCLNKSLSDKHFDMPDIKFDINNVYSRLFNNVILNANTLREKISKEKEDNKHNKNNHFLNYQNNSFFLNNKKSKIIKKKVTIRNNKSFDIKKENDFYYEKLPSFNVANIIKSSKGKEFNLRITPFIKKRCWSALSGGPKPKSKSMDNFLDKTEDKNEEIDYEDIRNKSIFNINRTKTKSNKNNMVLYNTLILDKQNRKKELVKVKNYRDENFNSNLHLAVKGKSMKLVKYFLNKRLDPNNLNKDGQTPLHIAIKEGNPEIAELLIKSGANINIKDNEGKKPFDYGSKEIIRYFNLDNHD
jgi:hypothetical protein